MSFNSHGGIYSAEIGLKCRLHGFQFFILNRNTPRVQIAIILKFYGLCDSIKALDSI
jgi:hypothetical protein